MDRSRPAFTDSISVRTGRVQFSLRAFLGMILLLGIVFGAAAAAPRETAFAIAMSLLLAGPLLVASGSMKLLALLGAVRTWPVEWDRNHSRFDPFARASRRVLSWLGLVPPDAALPLHGSIVVAVVYTSIVAGLWAPIRETGLSIAILLTDLPLEHVTRVVRSIPSELASSGVWLRLGRWELWAVGRWWLFFGTLTLACWTISRLTRGGGNQETFSATLSRLLTFAPWLVVLEMTFLIGVWIAIHNVVPEPSTGFVVGVFSWNLWHWDCWLDREWLIRGALPTFVVSVVFFRQVPRWSWPASLLASVCLIPVAIMLSIASTVLYLQLF